MTIAQPAAASSAPSRRAQRELDGSEIARFSWSAVVVAVLVGSVLQLMFALIGFSLGLAAAGPTQGQVMTASDLPAAALTWWFVTSLLALAAAGVIVGRLSPNTGLVGSALQGAAVWAIATIIALALTTTAIGSALTGTYSALVGSTQQVPAQRIELTVRDETQSSRVAVSPSGQERLPRNGTASAGPDSGANRQSPDGGGGRGTNDRGSRTETNQPVVSSLEALAWWGVLEASRQLQKPEVRERVRKIAVDAWKGSDDLRADIEAAVTSWIDAGGRIADGTAALLSGVLQQVLLLDASQARQLIGQWRDDIERSVDSVMSGSGGEAGQSREAGTPVAAIKAEILRELDELRGAVAQVIEMEGNVTGEARREVLSTIEEGFKTTRQQAEMILGRWEERISQLGKTTVSAAQTAIRETAEAGEAGLDAAATASAWLAMSLLFGLIAAGGGAVAGARLRY